MMIVNIQMLRFFAALAVVMAHMSERYQGMAGGMGLFGDVNALGRAGVDIFFVISGFIMWSTTVNTQGGRGSVRFILKRFARIYSGYWPFFLLFFLAYWLAEPSRLIDIDLFKSFFLLPQAMQNSLIVVSWTLFYELYFYLLIGLLLLLPRHVALKVLIGIAAIVLAVAIYQYQGARPAQLYIFTYSNFLLSPFILEFLAGCLVWELLQNSRFQAYRAALVMGVVLMLFGGWFNAEVMADTLFEGYYVPERVAVFGLASFLLVLGLVGLEKQGHKPRGKLFLYLGGASYAIYLSHTLFIGAFSTFLYPSLVGVGVPVASLVYLALIVVIIIYSVVHYLLIEDPLHKTLKQLIQRNV